MPDYAGEAVKFLAEELTKEFTSEIKTLRIAIIERERRIQDIIAAVTEHGHSEDALSQRLSEILGINGDLPERSLYTDEDTETETPE